MSDQSFRAPGEPSLDEPPDEELLARCRELPTDSAEGPRPGKCWSGGMSR